MTRAEFIPIVICLCLGTSLSRGRAQELPPTEPPPVYALGAYVEAFYQWNFARPWNGVTNYRAFDNRHNAFTVANIAVDAQWDYEDVIGRLTLQVGHTPSTYYMAEPRVDATGGANATDANLWKYLQQAYAGYRPFEALSVAAGIFLSPIGPESMAIKDNWHWSRSNLFFGLPFYHTGARASYQLAAWSFTVAAYNGWNSVVDGNGQKSFALQAVYTIPRLTFGLLYFGGGERPRDAPEGRPFRHLFDAHATWNVAEAFALMAHANGGFESNRRGLSRWVAGALSARVRVFSTFFVAGRADAFAEQVARDHAGSAAALFWPAPWVSAATATLEYRPHERVSLRLEYRHDHAGSAMYYGSRRVVLPDVVSPPTERSQDTLTLGTTTWF